VHQVEQAAAQHSTIGQTADHVHVCCTPVHYMDLEQPYTETCKHPATSAGSQLSICNVLGVRVCCIPQPALHSLQSGSNRMSLLAPTRLSPQPPALLESRNTNTCRQQSINQGYICRKHHSQHLPGGCGQACRTLGTRLSQDAWCAAAAQLCRSPQAAGWKGARRATGHPAVDSVQRLGPDAAAPAACLNACAPESRVHSAAAPASASC
jgi:hypothetical protein